MKLIREFTLSEVSTTIVENAAIATKKYMIEGVFMQAERVNKNNRVYPKSVLQREVEFFQEKINNKNALGELTHPESPIVDLNNVSHKIVELYQEGNNFIGKAEILSTPKGQIAKNLLDCDVKLGVSSRGLGDVNRPPSSNYQLVADNYNLITIDLVSDPSCPDSWVNGILEGKEWIIKEGAIHQIELEKINETYKKKTAQETEQAFQKLWETFLKRL